MATTGRASAPLYRPARPVRVVTAASLFDGHDAAINIIRRLLQAQGAEVVHLGHNRSVREVVTAAVQEDVHAVAVSSYQGGHIEYFEYLLDQLAAHGRPDIRVYGGGGGVIVAAEVQMLQQAGVARIFTPEDGQRLGLDAMVNTIIEECDMALGPPPDLVDRVVSGDHGALARAITCLEDGSLDEASRRALKAAAAAHPAPALGVTGTGGSGKSSLTDELVRRLRLDQRDSLRVAVLAVDPSRRKSGGALLGDRLRMNSIDTDRVYMRSLATRGAGSEVPIALAVILDACRAARFDLVLVETPGVGQGDSGIVSLVDRSVYVMTPEFGAPTQLEKIDMLDFADAVAINKFDRRGAPDALREVRRQLARAPERRGRPHDQLPVFGTVASHFNDDGVTALYEYLRDRLAEDGLTVGPGALPQVLSRTSSAPVALLPPTRSHYLAEVVQVVREYQARTAAGVSAARRRQQVAATSALLVERGASSTEVDELAAVLDGALDSESRHLLEEWPALAAKYRGDDGGRRSLAGTLVPRVSLPQFGDDGDLLRFLRDEHLPGHFPYTAGVFPFRRAGEGPTRMFAGEGGPLRTNRRFHLLAEGQPATRLSTAFDSVTLYGCDPAERPDIYGKIGNAGVSVATLDDMEALYHGFDLSSASTSVSMTINGPAPIILAMFFNVAIDQAVQRAHEQAGRAPTDDELMEIRAATLRQVRGTVQADILKEDQGQNTCIFSTEFALRTMADTQEWFVAQGVKNFYSVSISGYHIAEAGANPITQLAFTLANGFTYVEAYLARGMAVDTFAPNLSFFFSNGMDPEYTVIGRVARRIWAIAMRDRYGADARSQRLKYHVQTSGRSLHAQEMAFNDIRTTLQALCAIYDNANSLHTNAYDEAVTTPTEESVRRALAVQMIITREWGLAFNENMLQGSFIVEELTDLVEEAVLGEMERLNERGGVLGAMETGYQRGRVQDDSLQYELAKHDGSLPIVGVNTFVSQVEKEAPVPVPLARSTEEEKQGQLRRLAEFHRRHAGEAPGALAELQRVALSGENVFAALMSTARVASLGQITDALYAVGGRYRRAV